MASKLVNPNEPVVEPEKKMVRIYKPMPMIPREEAMRMRRATRNMADTLAPWALQELAQLAQDCEDPSVKHKVLMDILKISIAGKANEEVDPDAPTVDGSLVKDQLEALEKATEKTGTDTE
jgi:hypothetical protein